MTTQTPLRSAFGATSTATDVLAGIDLTGKLAIVTGGYSGIGLEATRALARAGAHVIVPARRPELAATALASVPGTEVAALDLGDLESVAAFADAFLASGRRIDILLANAGVMANPETRVGPGWESQFATNHLGHFALTNRLWPVINDGARIVVTSSNAHHITGMQWDNLQLEDAYDRWLAYGQSKTANVLFAVELDRRGASRDVRAFATHPGLIETPLQRHFTVPEQIKLGWRDSDGVVMPGFKSTAQGAATQVWAATSPALEGLGGVYCDDCDIAPRESVQEWATDPEQATRLWAVSAALTGVSEV